MVKNTAGTDRELFTYTGPSNILNLLAKDFTDLIFEHDESIDDPYELDQASFSSRNAFPNSEKERNSFQNPSSGSRPYLGSCLRIYLSKFFGRPQEILQPNQTFSHL